MDAESKRKQNGLKLKTVSLVMSLGDLAFSDRVVFWRLSESLDPVSLRCWLSQATIADRLGADIKTVKRALRNLEHWGLIQVLKIDYRNEYVLAQLNEQGELVLTKQENTRRERAFADCRGRRKRADQVAQSGGENGLRLPSTYPLSNSLSSQTRTDEASGDTRRYAVKESNERLSDQKGDELYEHRLVEIFDRMGSDGMDVMSALYEIDGGAPRLRLINRLRSGVLDASDLHSAILVAKKGGAGQKSGKFRS